MDTTDWLVSGIMPAAITAAACWWAGRRVGDAAAAGGSADSAATGDMPADDMPTGGRGVADGHGAAPLVLSLGWAIAVSAALLGQHLVAGDASPLWWPEEFWQRGYGCLLAAAVVLGPTAWSSRHASGGRWVLAGLLAVATAFTSLPSGAGWEDTLPLHRCWMLLLSGACLLGFWSLDRLGRGRSERWFALVVLALLAGPMLVAATTYSALVQWTIAAISATLVCVAFGLAGRLAGGVGIAYPAVAFSTVMIAAGRFYSYEDPPWWSYLGVLLIGPAVWLADRLVAGRSTLWRVTLAAGVATLMIAASAVWHLGELQ